MYAAAIARLRAESSAWVWFSLNNKLMHAFSELLISACMTVCTWHDHVHYHFIPQHWQLSPPYCWVSSVHFVMTLYVTTASSLLVATEQLELNISNLTIYDVMFITAPCNFMSKSVVPSYRLEPDQGTYATIPQMQIIGIDQKLEVDTPRPVRGTKETT